MNEMVHILKKIADSARKRYLELKNENSDLLSNKVSTGAYGHKSSYMDEEVEKEIIREVEENELPFNIFTEEKGWIDRQADRTLIVDPVDGSYNAEHGIPFYSISLAIGKKDLRSVEVALVKNVPLNIDYWAIRGVGAYRESEKLRTKSEKTGVFVIYLGKNASENAYEVAKKARRVRDLGCASLEMITVAEGIADLFYYSFKGRGALRIVDIAAAYLITTEAGGLVIDENMNPLNMGLDFNERKNVIAISSDVIREVFQ